ncbi:hypothetical protein DFH29DRAFT_805472 [Suillus ampliporus]|nr:hypothetical protein DFH29DRAFT_805472 [Suillus ampliporus]
MAKAWPLLEELYITRYAHSSYQVTPDAFVSLLHHCPCLVSLAITVDWHTIDHQDIPRDIPHHGFSHKALSELFFGGSVVDHPIWIAAFISAIAPNVKSITAWDHYFHGGSDEFLKNSQIWNLVMDSIKSLPLVHEQGRRMMNRG